MMLLYLQIFDKQYRLYLGEREVLLWLNNLYTNYQIIEEDTFEDLQDTYEFSKNHDRRNEREKDDFEIGI